MYVDQLLCILNKFSVIFIEYFMMDYLYMQLGVKMRIQDIPDIMRLAKGKKNMTLLWLIKIEIIR